MRRHHSGSLFHAVSWNLSFANIAFNFIYFWHMQIIINYLDLGLGICCWRALHFPAWARLRAVGKASALWRFHTAWGPKVFLMGTQWGPNFEWNGDQWEAVGTQWGPKNWKRSPWGPGSSNGDPCGSSALFIRTYKRPVSSEIGTHSKG